MDWDEAMEEARSNLGYSQDEYIPNFNRIIDEAKDILSYQKEEDYLDFCCEAHNKYREYLKSDRWKELRIKILNAHNFDCFDCKLNVPSKKYSVCPNCKSTNINQYKDCFLCFDCKFKDKQPDKNKATEVHHLNYEHLETPEEEKFCVPLCRTHHKMRHKIEGEKDGT